MAPLQESKITIVKRDGSTEAFTADKIRRAITKAYNAGGINNQTMEIDQIVRRVVASIEKESITVEEIQDIVEREIMVENPYIAKKYIIYR
ncbi:MAG: anaerobic ribonucleoside triphosphate reductase, partial [Opitutales bacterium]|nr:anaerobic ribonucleoside triphosphate reductase [Opitutales bacterium]